MDPLRALVLNCTLKPSPAESSTEVLANEVIDALAQHDVTSDLVRVVDRTVRFGVSTDEGGDDEWPAIREQMLAADILVIATPIWLGQLADPAGHPFDLCEKEGVGPQLALFAATVDAPDAAALARFYADLLGWEVTYDGPEGSLATDGAKSLMFQQVGDHTPPQWPDPARPQQAHFDVFVDDLEAAGARARALGATRLEGGGERFEVYADPAGHPFCLCL